MYKKIYTYLGIITLLWAYSSCNRHAAANRLQVGNDNHALQKKGQDTYEALRNVINPLKRAEKKNVVMVIGLPTVYLDCMSLDDKLYSIVHQLKEKAKITITSKPLPPLEKLMVESNEKWSRWREMETLFMQKTLCSNAYTQYYVKNSCYLPHIYCPNEQESNKPIYIVVRSLDNLVNGVFSEYMVSFTPPKPGKDKSCFTKRLDASVSLFTEYMKEVYKLVNIKALVINHDCKYLTEVTSGSQTHKLQNIDAAIRSFGNLLYLPNKENDQYTINPQVFWLSWYVNDDFKDIHGNIPKNKEEKFYYEILTVWFNIHPGPSNRMYRQVSLFYPFIKAHSPVGIAPQQHQDKAASSTLSIEDQEELPEYEQAYANMPKASLPQGNRQITLLNIDDIIPSLEKEKGNKQKEQEPRVFSTIKKALMDLVNNSQTPIISSDRFRFGFGMEYYYLYLYASAASLALEAGDTLRDLLCRQGDTVQAADPTEIGLEKFAHYQETYSTRTSVSFNSNTQDEANLLDQLNTAEQQLLRLLHDEFKVKPPQQANTSISHKKANHREHHPMPHHEKVIIAVIIVASCYILYHLMVLPSDVAEINQPLVGKENSVTTPIDNNSTSQQPAAGITKVEDTDTKIVDTNNTKNKSTNKPSTDDKHPDQQPSTKKPSTHGEVKESKHKRTETKEHKPTDHHSAVHKFFDAFLQHPFFFSVLLLMIILVGLHLRRKRKGK